MTLDTGKYSTDGNGYQGYNERLNGEWLIYNNVATKFVHKSRFEDRDDIRHTIILNLAVAGRKDGHKPDNPSWMYRIASFTIAQYWRDYYYRNHGIDCGRCSNQQRKKCKAQDLYRECPKTIKVEYLSKPIVGEDGQISELGELIADNKALDLADWTDINTFIRGLPQRLIDIAEKRRDGIPLNHNEQMYLNRFREKEQKP